MRAVVQQGRGVIRGRNPKILPLTAGPGSPAKQAERDAAPIYPGAGRRTAEDLIDHAVGITVNVRLGDRIHGGDPVALIHYNDEAMLESAVEEVKEAQEKAKAEEAQQAEEQRQQAEKQQQEEVQRLQEQVDRQEAVRKAHLSMHEGAGKADG